MNKKMQTELEELKRLIIKQNNEIETMKVSLSQIYEKLLRMDWEPNQNIRQKLFHLAGLETAEFITKKYLFRTPLVENDIRVSVQRFTDSCESIDSMLAG